MSRPIPIEEMVRLFKTRHTTSHLFKIDNFSLLKKHSVKLLKSSAFDLGGHKWKLCVYPNGFKNKTFAIFLENQAPINVNVEFELFIISQLHPTGRSELKRDFGTYLKCRMKGHSYLKSLAAFETDGDIIQDCFMFGVKLHGIDGPDKPGTAECFSLIEKPLNHKVTWMMTKFSSFDPEKVHHSNEFVVGTRKWRIKVHPRGTKEGKDKSFSVYLLREESINNAPKKKTYVNFKLRVLDQVTRNHVERSCSGWLDTELGFADFMPLNKLDKPYLVNDKLYVGVEFDVISVSNYC